MKILSVFTFSFNNLITDSNISSLIFKSSDSFFILNILSFYILSFHFLFGKIVFRKFIDYSLCWQVPHTRIRNVAPHLTLKMGILVCYPVTLRPPYLNILYQNGSLQISVALLFWITRYNTFHSFHSFFTLNFSSAVRQSPLFSY